MTDCFYDCNFIEKVGNITSLCQTDTETETKQFYVLQYRFTSNAISFKVTVIVFSCYSDRKCQCYN